VTEQETVDLFAKAAKPRLMDLLKLKVRHVYETTPGNAKSKVVIDGSAVVFKSVKSAQPYKDIERFVAEDKVIGFVRWTPFFGQKKTPFLDRAAALKMKESQCLEFARVTHPA
jgi:hypothetical protein